MDLAQLFNHYGTDKDVIGYTPVYHALFDRRRYESLSILEIGIGTMLPHAHSSMVGYALAQYKPGGSLRAWRDYFTNSVIYGVDIQPDTQFTEERIATYLCDSTDGCQVSSLFKQLNGLMLDIIIDDGSHTGSNQQKTLKNFYPHLKQGGFYIIEDLLPESSIKDHPGVLEPLCNRDPLFFAGLATTLCVIYKSHLERNSSGYGH